MIQDTGQLTITYTSLLGGKQKKNRNYQKLKKIIMLVIKQGTHGMVRSELSSSLTTHSLKGKNTRRSSADSTLKSCVARTWNALRRKNSFFFCVSLLAGKAQPWSIRMHTNAQKENQGKKKKGRAKQGRCVVQREREKKKKAPSNQKRKKKKKRAWARI